MFGSSPPVTVVSTGVDSGLGDSLADAEAEADGEALSDADALADGVALGTTAAHASLVIVFVSRVTAAFRAKSCPLNVAPVVAVIDSIAIT